MPPKKTPKPSIKPHQKPRSKSKVIITKKTTRRIPTNENNIAIRDPEPTHTTEEAKNPILNDLNQFKYEKKPPIKIEYETDVPEKKVKLIYYN